MQQILFFLIQRKQEMNFIKEMKKGSRVHKASCTDAWSGEGPHLKGCDVDSLP